MPLPPTALATSFLLAFIAFGGCMAGVVQAQPLGKTVVVPYFVGESEGPALDLAKQADAALRVKRTALIPLHDARDRFTARSRAPQTASLSDIDALAKEAHAAIEHVAFGRTVAAQRSVRQIIELAERSLETLNRETATARTLLDACLSLVRASLHDNKRDDAIEQAMRCRRLVPDLAPSEVSHPAVVVGALAEADDQLRRMRVGNLNVQVRPERGCEVYLNGRQLGHTPFFLDRAPVGEYRVQVECDAQPGRVHVVQLGEEPTQLTVDSAFDEGVRTDPRLALHYGTSDQARAALVAHATLAGREVRAEDVVLVGVFDAQAVLLRVQVRHERLIAGTSLSLNAPAGAVSQAIDQLAQARFAGVTPEDFRAREANAEAPQGAVAHAAQSAPAAAAQLPAARSATNEAATPLRPSHRTRVLRVTGGVLLATGIATLGAGFGLYARALTLKEDAEAHPIDSNEHQAAQAKYDDFRLMPSIGVAGSALATAALPMLMPKRPPRRPAGWVAGAIAGAAGIAMLVVGATQTRDDTVFGALLASTGAPLISVPITQLVRARQKPRE
jgi:hypothetical protein